MKRLHSPLPLRSLFVAGLLCLAASASSAQAPIEPSLPEAPLPHRRVLLLFPGYETVQDPAIPVAPLRPRQKFEMAYRKTIDPSFLVESAMFAGFAQVSGYGPSFGSDANGFAQRYGYYAAGLATTNLFTDGVLPVLLHQDPRYFRKGTGSVPSRIWWALRSEAIGFNDRGQQTVNVSSMLGFGMSTALSNAYSPANSNTLGNTMYRYGVKEGVSFALNLLREFGGLSAPEKHQQQQQ